MSPQDEKSIMLIGDMLIDRHLSHPSDQVFSLLNTADMVLGNFETTLATGGYPAAKKFRLRSDALVLEDLKKMNVKAVSLANNHALDFGFDGLFETMDLLVKNKIEYSGAGYNLAEALKPPILKLGNLRVALFSCASDMPTHAIAAEDRPGLAPLRVDVQINYEARPHQEYVSLYPNIVTKADEEDLNNLLMAVEKTKRDVDLVVVSIHWGLSLQPMVLEYQIDVAHRLIDQGVDTVMGHGPHVLHGLEMYKKRPIFYSLSNFVFHEYSKALKRTSASELAMELSHKPNKRAFLDYGFRWRSRESAIGKIVVSDAEIKRAEVIPITIENGDPQLCDSKSAMIILNYLSVFSRFLGASLTIGQGKGILRPSDILKEETRCNASSSP